MIHNPASVTSFNAKSPLESLGSELNKTKNCLKCVYDFAVLGGAIGTINLLDDQGNPAILPFGAIVQRSYLSHITACASGGAATVAVSTGLGAADVLAATAVASMTGILDGISVGTAATFKGPVVTASQMSPNGILSGGSRASIAVAAFALTAGKFNVFLEYVIQG